MPAINTRTRLASMPWVVLAFAVNPLPAFAEECVQEKAVYVDMDNAYELRFEPMGSESSVSNKFKLAVRNTAIVAEGIVMHGDDQPGADGRIMFECPEGDVTGADLRACTVWQGMIYASDLKGHILALRGKARARPTGCFFRRSALRSRSRRYGARAKRRSPPGMSLV